MNLQAKSSLRTPQVRAVPTHFIVLPNHQDPRIEHVAVANERFLVVEKEAKAAHRAEESDPRDRT